MNEPKRKGMGLGKGKNRGPVDFFSEVSLGSKKNNLQPK